MTNLAETSKQVYGSKRAILSMIMIIMMIYSIMTLPPLLDPVMFTPIYGALPLKRLAISFQL
jgi:hypothetical protein